MVSKLPVLAIVFLVAFALPTDAAPLSKGQAVKVMPVGDSITLGKNGIAGGYRRVLYEWLKANGYSITYVGKQNNPNPTAPMGSDGTIPWHEGYGSFRTDMILNGGTAEKQTAPPLAESLAKFQPDIVILMLGTNDIIQNYQLDGIEGRMRALLDAIYTANPRMTVLLATIAPILRPDWAEKETQVQAYNAALAELVKTQQAAGRSIQLVDVHSALDVRGLHADKVHPNNGGYAQMAAAFYEALTGEPAPAIDRQNPLLIPAQPTPTPTPTP